MGKHRHYRVCIDGEKDHSSGGWCYDHLMEWFDKNPDGELIEGKFPFGLSREPENPMSVVVFLITRMEKKYKRKLTGVAYVNFDKTTGGYELVQKCTNVVFDLRNPIHKENYDNLGKIYTRKNIFFYGMASINPDIKNRY